MQLKFWIIAALALETCEPLGIQAMPVPSLTLASEHAMRYMASGSYDRPRQGVQTSWNSSISWNSAQTSTSYFRNQPFYTSPSAVIPTPTSSPSASSKNPSHSKWHKSSLSYSSPSASPAVPGSALTLRGSLSLVSQEKTTGINVDLGPLTLSQNGSDHNLNDLVLGAGMGPSHFVPTVKLVPLGTGNGSFHPMSLNADVNSVDPRHSTPKSAVNSPTLFEYGRNVQIKLSGEFNFTLLGDKELCASYKPTSLQLGSLSGADAQNLYSFKMRPCLNSSITSVGTTDTEGYSQAFGYFPGEQWVLPFWRKSGHPQRAAGSSVIHSSFLGASEANGLVSKQLTASMIFAPLPSVLPHHARSFASSITSSSSIRRAVSPSTSSPATDLSARTSRPLDYTRHPIPTVTANPGL